MSKLLRVFSLGLVLFSMVCLAASPFVYKLDMPILLVGKDDIGQATANYLKDASFIDYYVIGGQSTISDKVLTNISLILRGQVDVKVLDDDKEINEKTEIEVAP